MNNLANAADAQVTAPQTLTPRILDLDVVRGFALFGIFLMNIEFFNRASSGIGLGMPLGLTGLDWFVSWVIAYFVQGKFWTIFSMLFGMGFAVMLERAEQGNRNFLAQYLRRIAGLAVFGAAHYIFLWSGDILFSYAVGACALLFLLYGKWKHILIAAALLAGIGFVPQMDPLFGVAGALALVTLLSLYLRSEHVVNLRRFKLPLFSCVLAVTGLLGVIGAIALWTLPNGPQEARIPVTSLGIAALLLAGLSAKYHQPAALRELRLGVTIYIFMFLMMTVAGAAQYFKPQQAPESISAGAPTDKAVEKKAERAKRLERREEETRNEVRILTSGSYLEAVTMRARNFPQKAAGDAGFSLVLMAMFLIGSWFVRSGVMANTGAHLPLFRKLVLVGLPLGIGLGLAGSLIAVSHLPGDDFDGFQLARGLAMLGNLPACLGYVGLVVLMLHGNAFWSRVRMLAPVGRMALTHYLFQSLVCSVFFFGYGLGHWGMSRAGQALFVVAVFALQVVFSQWWLSHFRYGPMEWFWRAFTYRQSPPMRLSVQPFLLREQAPG